MKKETSVIREAASRAVQDLPARFESGAAIAQESLEAVGQAIDNVGSTVSEIIGKDLNFVSDDGFSDPRLDGNNDEAGSSDKDLNFTGNAKPYSRIEAIVRGIQCNIGTYRDEVEESGYSEWEIGFRLDEKIEEIARLFEENGVIREIYDEVVPEKVDEGTFWCRYFYRVDKVVKAEEARVMLVKRAISGEEEELSWDVDDDENDEMNDEYKSKDGLKKDNEDKGKGADNSEVENEEKVGERDNEDAGASGTKSTDMVDEENLGEGLTSYEKESSEGKLGSDISIISSQRSSHTEDDLGWDEIEDIGSGDESKITERGSPTPSNETDLRKRLSAAEEDEDLKWDIEDDDEPTKL